MAEELAGRIIAIVADNKRVSPERVTLDTTLLDLGYDSLDAMNLLFALEEEFKISIPDAEARSIKTVAQAVEGVRALLDAKAAAGRA